MRRSRSLSRNKSSRYEYQNSFHFKCQHQVSTETLTLVAFPHLSLCSSGRKTQSWSIRFCIWKGTFENNARKFSNYCIFICYPILYYTRLGSSPTTKRTCSSLLQPRRLDLHQQIISNQWDPSCAYRYWAWSHPHQGDRNLWSYKFWGKNKNRDSQ